ncbi:hypothetical protein GCM10009808_18660 [Microbacterium sediminicola]|uniref:DUF2127 domain-containing protein n=1 Tax=Microbacterium sediminicola TaxID=415210 RepID=A0ABN2IAN8_9MICO
MTPQSSPHKRAAYEPPVSLLRPVAHDPDMPRPVSIMAGTLIILLRVLAGTALIAAVWLDWPDLIDEFEDTIGSSLSAADEQIALWTYITLIVVALLIQLTVVYAVWRGHNWARVLIMALAVVSISVAFVTWFLREQEITLQTTLFAIGLDVLTLLALSSRSAAAYSRRNDRP